MFAFFGLNLRFVLCCGKALDDLALNFAKSLIPIKNLVNNSLSSAFLIHGCIFVSVGDDFPNAESLVEALLTEQEKPNGRFTIFSTHVK